MLILNILLSIYAFIMGSVFASFFGVVCDRVPKGLSIVKPNSHCDNCNHELKWYENISIFSYIFLKGKCKECGEKIGISSLIYEIIGGVSFTLVYLKFQLSISTLFYIAICAILLLMAMYDYYTQNILDIMWILFLVFSAGLYAYNTFVLKYNWYEPLIGVGIALVFFLTIKLIGYLALKRDILGTGDIIVISISGLFLSYLGVIYAILIGSLVGSIIELIKQRKRNEDSKKEIAFLPYLNLGIYASMLTISYIIGLLF